jgi:hypothetical protein
VVRRRDGSGYRADVCADGVTVRTARDLVGAVELDVPFTQPIEQGGTARMRFSLSPAGGIAISRDGATLADAPMAELRPSTGTLRLGIAAPTAAAEPAEVRFTDLDVRALS